VPVNAQPRVASISPACGSDWSYTIIDGRRVRTSAPQDVHSTIGFMIRITTHDRFEELLPWRSRWNELARGIPFCRWEWLEAWWRHYGIDRDGGGSRQLCVVALWEHEELIGIAPWFTQPLWVEGKSLRALGDGEVCSEYVTLLVQQGKEDEVGASLARWLSDSATGDELHPIEWDVLELCGVVPNDRAVNRLVQQLSEYGNNVYARAGFGCWRIELPRRWDDYLGRLSKSHRKQVRRAARQLARRRVVTHYAKSAEELQMGFEVLVQLHQRRWQSLGQRGCFDLPGFLPFHREVSLRLFGEGCVDLTWLALDGRPLAAEYHLLGNDTVYAYQSGIDPDRLEDDPGRLAVTATMQRSIERGFRSYDFLRGDEPYKAHWRAQRQTTAEIRVVPQHAAARVRQGVWTATDRVKSWIKSGLELARLR
jgi:hypothetical protein